MPVWSLLTRYAAPIAVLWGVGAVIMANMSPVDATFIGFVAKTLYSAFGFLLALVNWRRIIDNLDGGEVLCIALFSALCVVASFVAMSGGEPFSLYRLVRVLFINVDIFLVAKLLDSRAAIESYVGAFALLCVVASLQSILSVAAAILGVRYLFPLHLTADVAPGVLTETYYYPWFGLLGRVSTNIRTMFYFSEPAYYGQMLTVGLIAAFAARRPVQIVIIGLGLFSSFAIAAWGGVAVALVAIMLRYRLLKESLIVGVLVLLGFMLILPVTEQLGFASTASLFNKFTVGASGSDKTNAFFYLSDYINANPLGAGLVDLEADFNQYFNSSPSPISLVLYFGVLSLPVFAMLCLPPIWQGMLNPANRYGGVLWVGLGGAMIATLTAGPLLKYWMVFMFSALLTLRRIDLDERASAIDAVATVRA